MKILYYEQLEYQSGLRHFPRHVHQFVVEATKGEREALADWCELEGLDLWIRATSWSRGRVLVRAPTGAKAALFSATWGEPVPQPFWSAAPDPFNVWAAGASA